MRIDLTIAQIGHLRGMLAGEFEDDERGWIDALEGETDAFIIARKLLDSIEADEGVRTALTEQMDTRKVRRDRCDVRIAARRDALMALMNAAGVDKLPLPEASLTIRETPAKLVVASPDAVPFEYQVATYKPDMATIKADHADADTLPNWLTREPARSSLTIRRK